MLLSMLRNVKGILIIITVIILVITIVILIIILIIILIMIIIIITTISKPIHELRSALSSRGFSGLLGLTWRPDDEYLLCR